jgi:hypothetical protein
MEDTMSDTFDLEAIKARLAATTPGDWLWDDIARTIPYEDGSTYMDGREDALSGNDGSLGVMGLYVEHQIDENSWDGEPLLYADDENFPDDPNDPDKIDFAKWRGLIQVKNVADLTFITEAKNDIAALIIEVERLQTQHPLDPSLNLARGIISQLRQAYQDAGAPHGITDIGLILWLLEGRIVLPVWSK